MPVKNNVQGQAVAKEKVERAKELRREMTPAERVLLENLRANQLGGFHIRRQQIIDGFIVDFYCHAAAVVIEVDGEVHDQQIEEDFERDRVLQERGLRVLRYKNKAILENLQMVLAEILITCKERIC